MRTNSEIKLIGNLGGNPEVFALNAGGFGMRFSIAVSHWYKMANGEEKESTSWFTVCCFGKIVERLKTELVKGSRIIVIGEMIQREYTDKEGKLQRAYEVSASRILQLYVKPKDAN